MKRIFTLLAAAFLSLKSFADYRNAQLIINYPDRNNVWVEVDGRRYNDRDGRVTLSNLEPGRHRVEVFEMKIQGDIWKGIIGMRKRKEYIYDDVIYLRPGTELILQINRKGQVQMDERRIGRGRNRNDRDDRDDRDDRRWNDRDRQDDNDRRYDRDYDRNYNRDYNRNVMDNRSFEMLKQALRRENFENSRLDIVKQTIDRNSFSAVQVRELCLLFAFEHNRLALAKYAYAHTVDRQNYHIVYDVFSFRGSRDELADYCRR